MPEENAPRSAGIYELLMLGLCIYVLITLTATTFCELDAANVQVLEWADTAVCLVFLMDFLVQLFKAQSKLQYLKWGWIDLVSSIPTIGMLRWGRLVRVVRIVRLLRGVKSVKTIAKYLTSRRADSAFAVAAFLAMLTVVLSSVAILHFERDAASANIRTAEDALWWACVTITTAGYGDRYPVTTEGRIVAIIAMTAGVGLFGTFTAFVARWFIQPRDQQREEQLQTIQETLQRLEVQLRQVRSP